MASAGTAGAVGAVVETVGGGGVGDGGTGLNSLVLSPDGLSRDAQQNLYIADSVANRVRKLSPSGMITTIAGSGVAGYSGDGGSALLARLNGPHDVAVTPDGSVLIADTTNNRIRRVAPSGTISTFAGTGVAGSSGDGGAATAARLNSPRGISVDPVGNVYISDTNNGRIRMVTADGKISTVAGGGPLAVSNILIEPVPATLTTLNRPARAIVDPRGNLLIADTQARRVRRVDKTTGLIQTVAGNALNAVEPKDGSLAILSGIGTPYAIAAPPCGSELTACPFYFTDSTGGTMYRVDQDGKIFRVANFNATLDLEMGDGGDIYLSEMDPFPLNDSIGSGRVWLLRNGALPATRVAGNGRLSFTGDGLPARDAAMDRPVAVSAAADGGLLVADVWNKRIRRIDNLGVITTVAGGGSYPFRNGSPAIGNYIARPNDVVADPAGNIYISSSDELNSVIRVEPSGAVRYFAGGGGYGYSGDGGPATSAGFHSIGRIALGPDGSLYIADYSVVRKVDPSGTISRMAGNGCIAVSNSCPLGDSGSATAATLGFVRGLVVDGSGNLFITGQDLSGGTRVRKVDTSGKISTFAGNGTCGFSGDGGPATSASICAANGLAIANGSLYIADSGNQRIRRVSASGFIETVAGNGSSAYVSEETSPLETAMNPIDVDVIGPDLVITDYGNNRIRSIRGFVS